MCIVQTLFRRADRCAARSTWKDFALVKLCLAALGVLIGLSIPAGKRRGAGVLALLTFIPTYVLLIRKFFPILFGREEEDAG